KAIFNFARSGSHLLGSKPPIGLFDARIRCDEQRRIYCDHRRNWFRQDNPCPPSLAQARSQYQCRPCLDDPARAERTSAMGDDVAQSAIRRKVLATTV